MSSKWIAAVIGLTFWPNVYAIDIPSMEEASATPGMVLVEPTNIEVTKVDGSYELESYRQRRNPWGFVAGIGYSSFYPSNYEPNFIAEKYDDVYKTTDVPMIELQLTAKRNFSFGSVGAELGAGMSESYSDSDLIDSDLRLIPVRVGFSLMLDTLYKEPYFVPYATAGVYTIFYSETMEGNSFNGNTQVAPYVTVGAQFQLDWLDRRAARVSFQDSGIQSTFVYAEARKYFVSAVSSDPDFETTFDPNIGLRVEF